MIRYNGAGFFKIARLSRKRRIRTYDLESVRDDADGHELLAVVAAVHHERVGETLNDGALGLAETLGGIAASSVREVDWLTDLDVVTVRKRKKSRQC